MYLLEGNTGSGKTTLLKLIEKELPQFTTVTEPVNSWHSKSIGNESLLENFYKNTSRWAYTMETFTLITRIKEQSKLQKNSSSPKIMERSIYSGYYCFAKNCYLQGNMTNIEWHIYNSWFQFLIKKIFVLS